jgi:transposase
MGHITMSSKEAPRPGLLKAALKGKLTNREVARALNLSVRHVRRLRRRYEQEGLRGLVHRLRDRPSNRRLSPVLRERVVALMTSVYTGLNDHHLTEKLRERESLPVSRSSVRRLRLELGHPSKHRRRPPRYFRRREREARPGQRVLLDASEHHWLGEDQPRFAALAAQDDATGEIVALTFRPHEDLHGYAVALQQTFTHRGLPLELYGDRFGAFVRNDDHWSLEEQLAGRQRPTQLGHAFEELGITYIAAGTPQAKGRIERLWGTLHDRLTAELRLAGISTVETALAFVPSFLEDYRRRFAVAPRDPQPAWRPPPHHLDRALACRYHRIVARDTTVSIPGRLVQLPRGTSRPGTSVEIRELLDGRLLVLHQGHIIATQPAPPGPFILTPREARRRRRLASLGIDLQTTPRSHDLHAAQATTPPPITPKPVPMKPPRRQPPNHPWRRRFVPLTSPTTR